MNRRGQALVEFVLILPVFLLILFTIVDFGNLLYTKNMLENQSTDIVLLFKEKKSVEEVSLQYKDIDIGINSYLEHYQKIVMKKKFVFINPVLSRILGNPFYIVVERVVPNDEQ